MKVLIIDDERSIRNTLKEILEFEGHQVTLAEDGASGLEAAFPVRWVLIMALTSFGGFCASAQTYSMIQGTGLKISVYLIEKLVTAVVTSCMCILYLCMF